MKKLFNILTLLFAVLVLFGCVHNTEQPQNPPAEIPQPEVEENFSTTTVFNPNSTKIKLISVSSARAAKEQELCLLEPLEKKEVSLGDQHDYYFTDEDGNKIADMEKSKDDVYLPVYLELNEPKDGKNYILLNQYRNADILESYPRVSESGKNYMTYSLMLFEVVEPGDLDAVRYDDNTYVRAYPSANYWIDSEGYTSNKIGTIITYNEAFRENFTALSNSWAAWGWSTKNEKYDIYFCHRVVSSILHAKDGNNYEVKYIGPKVEVTFFNPTNNKIDIYNNKEEKVATINPNETAIEKLYQNYPYYYADGSYKVEIKLAADKPNNFILKLEKPENDKKYICLNQNRLNDIEISDKNYGFRLYEIVDNTAENAVAYSDMYIRAYPSCTYWINDAEVAFKFIGKQIIYSDDLFSNYAANKGVNWGWPTVKNGKRYYHLSINVTLTAN